MGSTQADVETQAETQFRRELHAAAREDLLGRLSSNAEAYDKAILTLSSAVLALSVTFIKDVLPVGSLSHAWLLYWSWIFLTGAITGTVLSFRISDAALNKQLTQIDQYYFQYDETALTRTGLSRLADWTNNFAGGFFVAGMVLTVCFAGVTFSETRVMTKPTGSNPTHTNDGQSVPHTQRVVTDLLKKGQTVPNVQAVPTAAPKPSPSASQPSGQGSTPAVSPTPQTKK